MRRVPLVVVALVVVVVAACGGSTPKVEQSVLVEEQAKYEERLRKQEEEARREKKAWAAEKAELDRAKKAEAERIEQLEIQLADKQRLLDEQAEKNAALEDALSKLPAKERQKTEAEREKDKPRRASRGDIEARILEAMKPEIDEKKAEEVEREGGVVLRFLDGALFQQGSTRLQSSAHPAIERLAKALKATPEAMIRFDVHTDAVRAEHKGERKDTWLLTQEQGLELVRALQRLGVDPSRLAYTSYGQFRPIAPNDTEEGRAKNRRVEVVVRRDFR